jgi:uncharacterized protein (TIGR00156 family)
MTGGKPAVFYTFILLHCGVDNRESYFVRYNEKFKFFKEFDMKRSCFVCLMVLLTLAGLTVYAQEGGYTGPGTIRVTVEEAKELRDNDPVSLRGKIERFLGDEKYLFSDESGRITVEIDNRLWRGITVNQDDLVEITGEIDKDFLKVEVEVTSLTKI